MYDGIAVCLGTLAMIMRRGLRYVVNDMESIAIECLSAEIKCIYS
jgi:hypothetical protein